VPNLDLVTTAEVAAELRVHVRTVHRMIEAGKLAPIAKAPGLRGAYLFSREDIDALREPAA
jgi:excisionase family DNA binding protein